MHLFLLSTVVALSLPLLSLIQTVGLESCMHLCMCIFLLGINTLPNKMHRHNKDKQIGKIRFLILNGNNKKISFKNSARKKNIEEIKRSKWNKNNPPRLVLSSNLCDTSY